MQFVVAALLCRINNCVGEENQFAFMLLLLYAFLLSVVTLVIQFKYFFQLDVCVACNKVIIGRLSGKFQYLVISNANYGKVLFTSTVFLKCSWQSLYRDPL